MELSIFVCKTNKGLRSLLKHLLINISGCCFGTAATGCDWTEDESVMKILLKKQV